jgi:uncharacterized phage protein (TIGR01671 family)
MRAIKFRAWVPQVKEWLQDVTLKEAWQSGRALEDFGTSRYEAENISGISWEFDDLVFMQYTGLKDKNGVEIYEGDIVRTNHSFVEVGEVKFQLGQFIMKYHSLANSLPRLVENKWTLEVIGNAYENPELIK